MSEENSKSDLRVVGSGESGAERALGDKTSIWETLPEEVLSLIMTHYKSGLHHRISLRPPVPLYYGAGKTYCEACDRKKNNVAWFRNAFASPVNGLKVYSACPPCMRYVPPGHK